MVVTFAAVPGALWPGAATPGQVQTVPAPAGPPVIFTVVTARHLWAAVRARNSGGSGMQLTQPAVSLQAVQVMISAIQDGDAYDPSSLPVAMAFIADPASGAAAAPAASAGSWNAATWETDSAGGTSRYWCSCLAGPGGVTLTAGTAYTVFVKITSASSGEVPILPACGLMIT